MPAGHLRSRYPCSTSGLARDRLQRLGDSKKVRGSQRRSTTQPATRLGDALVPMLLVAAIERCEAKTLWEPGSKLKQGSVGSRDWCELARSPTEPSSGMQNAQHQTALIRACPSERSARTST